ncbi:MAG: hypothetical protein WBC04_19310 [Candidatus Acidiferrales bacterium]
MTKDVVRQSQRITSGPLPKPGQAAIRLILDGNIIGNSCRPADTVRTIKLPDIDALISASSDGIAVDDLVALHQLVCSIGNTYTALARINQSVAQELGAVGSFVSNQPTTRSAMPSGDVVVLSNDAGRETKAD